MRREFQRIFKFYALPVVFLTRFNSTSNPIEFVRNTIL